MSSITSSVGGLSNAASQVGNISGAITQVGNLLGVGATTVSDDVTLVIGNQQISGWTRIKISCGIEKLPRDFDIEFTEDYPGTTKVTVIPGAPCQVKIGKDVVVTGYVDRYIPSINADSHSIRVMGRGKCQDLVDCSVEWKNSVINPSNAFLLAQQLVLPYGQPTAATTAPANPILVSCAVDPTTLKATPRFRFIYSETPAEIIERVCRFSALLFYETPTGDLLLSRIGTVVAACGFQEGVNVQSAQATFSMDQRFSEYTVKMQSMGLLGDQSPSAAVSSDMQQSTSVDNQVLRHRETIIVSESSVQGYDLAKIRAQWELNKRFGKSFKLELVTDGWRDSAGALWTPNTLVPLELPSMKIRNKNYVINEVTYIRDESGTTARLVLYPPEAFDILFDPLRLNPVVELAGRNFDAGSSPNANPGAPNQPSPSSSPATPPTASDIQNLGEMFDTTPVAPVQLFNADGTPVP